MSKEKQLLKINEDNCESGALHPIIAGSLSRISIAKREERPKSVVIKPDTYRILQRYMVGNCADTLEMLCEIADVTLRKAQENIR